MGLSRPLSLMDLPQGDVRRIVRASESVIFPRGTLLCRENDVGHHAFYLRRGVVEIFKECRGRRRTLAHHGAGEWVGEMALLERKRRTASVRAIEPVRALALHADTLHRILGENPRLSLQVMEMMAQRIQSSQQDLLDELMAKMEQLEQANERLEARVADRTRDLETTHQGLQRLAHSDYLTGAYNRRWLMDELGRWCRSGRPAGVVLLDVDHFKHYNDHNGHLLGDALLRDLVCITQSQLRPGDTIARYGGEEFVILLHGVRGTAALEVAQRVRARIAAHRFPAGSSQPLGAVTVTAGVATIPEDGSHPDDVLRRADERLYQGKATGRNRVVPAPTSR